MDNRLAKEDTLLVFFTWLAYYFYLRAKSAATKDPQQAAKYYGASGASFGLMLASKYFPHYLGLNCLYHYLFGKKQQGAPLRRRDMILLLGACALLFVLFNPLVLLPNTLRYMLHYAGEGTMTHHGYLMMGRFYYDDPAHLQGGMPIYFYPLLLAIKTPLPVIGAFLVGLVEVWRRRREPGSSFLLFMFLFWIVPFSLLSAKWLRYMLAWMPTVTMIAAIGLAKILSWSTVLAKRPTRGRLASALAGVLAAIFLLEPAWVSAKSGPYYSLYLNPLGRGRVGYYFPHDEVNDMGLREAIQQICERASQRAMVGGETQPVFNYYFHQFGRDDLRYFDLSDPVKRVEAPPSAYLVVQDGRKYFENISFIQRVESYQSPVRTVDVGGAHAVRIYQDQEFAQLRMDR
jgi:Dolichyl-phosphate-mannose-protein mannosyltransferase